MKAWWAARQEKRAKRFLGRHEALARDILRRDIDFASQLVLQGAGSPERTTLEFPGLGWGSHMGGHSTLPKPSPGNLRRFSETPPARRAINAVADPIVELGWRIERRPPDDHDQKTPLPPVSADQHRRILRATQLFRRPNPDLGWRTFIEMFLEDALVLGAGSAEIAVVQDADHPVVLWPVDTQSIHINTAWDGNPQSIRYRQSFIHGRQSGAVDVPLRDEELLYLRLNPRSSTPFGLGPLEVAFRMIGAFLGAFDFAERRASNATPSYILALGMHVTMEQTRRWRHYWEHEIEGRGKIPIIGGGEAPSVLPLIGAGDDPLWLKWQEFQLRMIAISFGLSPMRLGVEHDVNYNTASISAMGDWASIAPVAHAIRVGLTEKILHQRLGWADLHFTWELEESDKLKQAQITDLYYRMDALTVDEVREQRNQAPLPDGRGRYTYSEYQARRQAHFAAPPHTPNGEEHPDDEEPRSPLPWGHNTNGVPAQPGTDPVARPAR